ncbi:hypothetical protein V5799_019438 [Amblyomma americanum]|uniref:Uncharacterized protein n=1 Tax=Amblyomma americanum TaxID=6943 RepID=A0AAQ4EWZ7_AMBAM
MPAKDYMVPLNPQPHPPAPKEADKKGWRQRGHYTDAAWESAPNGAQVLPVLAVYVVILLVTTFLLLLLLILTTRPSSRNASSSSPAPFADRKTTSTVAATSTTWKVRAAGPTAFGDRPRFRVRRPPNSSGRTRMPTLAATLEPRTQSPEEEVPGNGSWNSCYEHYEHGSAFPD